MPEHQTERENEARQRKEEAERCKREHQAKLEKARIKGLLGQASALPQASDIRVFVEMVIAAYISETDPLLPRKVNAWAAWALAEADRIDPIRSGQILNQMKEEAEQTNPSEI